MPGDFGDSTSGRYDNYGAVNPNDPSVANGQISPEAWAEYQKKRRRDAIIGILSTLGGTAALGFAGNAINGAASASVPGAVGASEAPLGVGSVAGGTLSATPFTSLAPYAGTVAGSGAGAAAGGTATAAAGGAGAGRGILGSLTTRDIAALGLTGASAIGAATADRPNMNPTTTTSDPNFLKLIQSMQGRLDKSEPLYDSILSMANGLLPTQYQKGGGGMG